MKRAAFLIVLISLSFIVNAQVGISLSAGSEKTSTVPSNQGLRNKASFTPSLSVVYQKKGFGLSVGFGLGSAVTEQDIDIVNSIGVKVGTQTNTTSHKLYSIPVLFSYKVGSKKLFLEPKIGIVLKSLYKSDLLVGGNEVELTNSNSSSTSFAFGLGLGYRLTDKNHISISSQYNLALSKFKISGIDSNNSSLYFISYTHLF